MTGLSFAISDTQPLSIRDSMSPSFGYNAFLRTACWFDNQAKSILLRKFRLLSREFRLYTFVQITLVSPTDSQITHETELQPLSIL